MSLPMLYVLVILCAFLLGGVPFFYLYNNIMAASGLRLISTRRFPISQTYELSFYNHWLMGLFIFFDLIKGVFAVYLGDLILGPSDFSLVLTTFFCLFGNLASQYFLKKDYISSLFILGLFIQLSPMITIFVLSSAMVLLFIFKNIFIFEIILTVFFVIYYLATECPISFLAYSVFVCIYFMLLEYNDLKRLFDRFI